MAIKGNKKEPEKEQAKPTPTSAYNPTEHLMTPQEAA